MKKEILNIVNWKCGCQGVQPNNYEENNFDIEN